MFSEFSGLTTVADDRYNSSFASFQSKQMKEAEAALSADETATQHLEEKVIDCCDTRLAVA